MRLAVPANGAVGKIDAWWTAVDVEPMQLPEQRLTSLSRSGLLLY